MLDGEAWKGGVEEMEGVGYGQESGVEVGGRGEQSGGWLVGLKEMGDVIGMGEGRGTCLFRWAMLVFVLER